MGKATTNRLCSEQSGHGALAMTLAEDSNDFLQGDDQIASKIMVDELHRPLGSALRKDREEAMSEQRRQWVSALVNRGSATSSVAVACLRNGDGHDVELRKGQLHSDGRQSAQRQPPLVVHRHHHHHYHHHYFPDQEAQENAVVEKFDSVQEAGAADLMHAADVYYGDDGPAQEEHRHVHHHHHSGELNVPLNARRLLDQSRIASAKAAASAKPSMH